MLSPEREGRFTASNHSIPLGLNPYTSPAKFWRQWHGLEHHSPETLARFSWGTENEPNAVAGYEAETGEIVSQCLDRQIFVPWEHWSGCTPDGFVGDAGLLETKCPTKQYETPPVWYWPQVQSQLHFTNREWADLCAWTPEEVRVWRVTRSTSYWGEVESLLKKYYETLTTGLEPGRTKKPKLNLEIQWTRII